MVVTPQKLKPFSRWITYECVPCTRCRRQQPFEDGSLRPTPVCECGRQMTFVADSASCQHAHQRRFSTGKVTCADCGLTLAQRGQ
jgi:hypothetical protein